MLVFWIVSIKKYCKGVPIKTLLPTTPVRQPCTMSTPNSVTESASGMLNPQLARDMLNTLRLPNATHIAALKVTVKDHKPAGAVSHFNLHTSPASLFCGLSMYIADTVDAELPKLPHLLRSIEHFIQILPSIPVPDSTILVRLDIKHFFISGDVIQLAKFASNALLMPTNVLYSMT